LMDDGPLFSDFVLLASPVERLPSEAQTNAGGLSWEKTADVHKTETSKFHRHVRNIFGLLSPQVLLGLSLAQLRLADFGPLLERALAGCFQVHGVVFSFEHRLHLELCQH